MCCRMESIEERQSSIQEFYSGTNVLITGGTGFVGKAVMEKLLRACPDINNIYLLIRGKKGKDPNTRLEEMFDDPVSIYNMLQEEWGRRKET